MELFDDHLYVENGSELSMCKKAAEIGSGPTRSLAELAGYRETPCSLSSRGTFLVLKGLAEISLFDPNSDYHGLSQEAAYKAISELLGDPEEPYQIFA